MKKKRNDQEQNVRREIRLANEMYFDGKNNSPYAFHTEFLTHYGDSSYMILDTSEGQTLEAYVREKGRLSIEEAIESIERLLVIVEQLLGDKYCHGDIKGQISGFVERAWQNHFACLISGVYFLMTNMDMI